MSCPNYVSSLADMDLAANMIISIMLSGYENTCLLREVKPLGWNLSLSLGSLNHLPYTPQKLSSDKHYMEDLFLSGSCFGQKG